MESHSFSWVVVDYNPCLSQRSVRGNVSCLVTLFAEGSPPSTGPTCSRVNWPKPKATQIPVPIENIWSPSPCVPFTSPWITMITTTLIGFKTVSVLSLVYTASLTSLQAAGLLPRSILPSIHPWTVVTGQPLILGGLYLHISYVDGRS